MKKTVNHEKTIPWPTAPRIRPDPSLELSQAGGWT